VTKAKPWKRSRLGCLARFLLLGVLIVAGLILAGDYVFQLRSNATYYAFQDSKEPLQVKMAQGGWKAVAAMTVAELDHALVKRVESKGVVWKTLRVRREPTTDLQRLTQTFFSAQLTVIEFAPQHFQFATSFLDRFVLTTARERLLADNAVFAINANFYDEKLKPLGMVVHEGQQRNNPNLKYTGYFFVRAGKPGFGPRSLFEETPGVLQEACQVYPSVMKNHTVFSYVDAAPTKYYDGEKITYRALAGMRQNGTIVFILSGRGGVMNVAEVTALAQKLNVQHATLLDGGRALQYSIHLPGATHHFSAFNTQLEFDSPALKPQRSPVYITVKDYPAGM